LAGPFNISDESLTLADFTPDEIKTLYRQHTDDTGQVFDDSALSRAWYWSQGQPWLANALAGRIISRYLKNDFTVTITGGLMDMAADELILRRDPHLESLLDRLKEPRARRVMEPVILGNPVFTDRISDDDTGYVLDLGLLKASKTGKLKPANPVYRETIARKLSECHMWRVSLDLSGRWMDGGKLDMSLLLKSFQGFWRENSGMTDPNGYNESVFHLALFAFLQRVLDGGADSIQREYALGNGRLDLNVTYGQASYPLELKVKDKEHSIDRTVNEGRMQLAVCMETCGAAEGWLVVLDRTPDKSWDEKLFWKTEYACRNALIHAVGC
jgi:hypothetical protein